MSMKNRVVCQIIIMIAIGTLLFGCVNADISTAIPTPLSGQMDLSPFTGIPCAAPCWYGLEVGKSTENDVISVLSTLTFIDQETMRTYKVSMPNYDYGKSAPGILIEANCTNTNQKCLTLAVIDNILTKIIVGFNYSMSQGAAVEYLGEPDYIGYGNLGSEKIICEVYLVWVDSRLVLATRFEDFEQAEKYCYIVHNEGKAPSSLLILEARYLSEAELAAYLSSISNEFYEFTGTIPE